jgi:hypothetical protein
MRLFHNGCAGANRVGATAQVTNPALLELQNSRRSMTVALKSRRLTSIRSQSLLHRVCSGSQNTQHEIALAASIRFG